jgi:hypothetical protein
MRETIDREGLLILAIVAASIAPMVLFAFWLWIALS